MIAPAILASLAETAGLGAAVVYVTDLAAGGGAVAVDAGTSIYPASMIKTPLAVAAAIAEREGRVSWSEPLDVDQANMTPNDAPSPLVPGARASLRVGP